MSTILKRTIFADTDIGFYRFHDWALVLTSLGAMMEPFCEVGARGGNNEIDWEEDMQRVDEIQPLSMDSYGTAFFGGEGTVIHGGTLMPRDGR